MLPYLQSDIYTAKIVRTESVISVGFHLQAFRNDDMSSIIENICGTGKM
jgi:hypothetical protein